MKVVREKMSFPSRLTKDPEFVEGIVDVIEHIKDLRNEIKILKEEAEFVAGYIADKGLAHDFAVKYKERLLSIGINVNGKEETSS